ncbi:hypothetical protein DH2020_029865 [Rehmannia glutinosa]|uniref:AP2/ERF domain-containing protein n=1 Tax=Rehmannia glutinosa TaxID=99300 RepID=A0ABR0VRG5_REHGL
MASLNNNWLGFSVSAQELQNHSQNIGFNSDEISADWNMKDLSMNSNFSCSSTQNMENQERPKLENFLGHCFSDHQEHNNKNLCNPNFNISSSNNYCDNSNYNSNILSQENDHDKATSHTNSTIGLSMIKNWLRNNPAPPHAGENNVGNEAAPPAGAQTLSLSMSTGSQSSTPLPLLSGNAMESCTSENNKLQQCGSTAVVDGGQTGGAVESMPRKAIDTFGQRTSIYRGVTRHRWTGRYEAHLWDNSCRREGQTRKGRQGGYDKEEKAARAYDLAALKYWGTTTTTNFPVSTQEEAAEAYDIAAIKFRGLNAVTNFEINRYDVKSILESTTLPIGGAAKRLKDAENAAEMALELHRANEANLNLHLTDHGHMNSAHHNTWPTIAFQQPPHPLSINYPFAPHQSRIWCKQEHDSDVNNHGYNEINANHQLQLGNTQNFLQPSVLTNIMSLQDNSSVEHSSGSNSVIYGNNVVPMMGTVIVQDATNGFQDGYEGMFGSSSADAAYQQQARNFYYHQSQQSSSSTCNNNWIPTAVPTVAANSTFTVWNDT